jgi:hypothetical protein
MGRSLDEPLPFGSLGTRRKEQSLFASLKTKRICRLRFSFFANDFGLALARRTASLAGCWRSARARHEPRRPVGLARLRLEAIAICAWAEGL